MKHTFVSGLYTDTSFQLFHPPSFACLPPQDCLLVLPPIDSGTCTLCPGFFLLVGHALYTRLLAFAAHCKAASLWATCLLLHAAACAQPFSAGEGRRQEKRQGIYAAHALPCTAVPPRAFPLPACTHCTLHTTCTAHFYTPLHCLPHYLQHHPTLPAHTPAFSTSLPQPHIYTHLPPPPTTPLPTSAPTTPTTPTSFSAHLTARTFHVH